MPGQAYRNKNSSFSPRPKNSFLQKNNSDPRFAFTRTNRKTLVETKKSRAQFNFPINKIYLKKRVENHRNTRPKCQNIKAVFRCKSNAKNNVYSDTKNRNPNRKLLFINCVKGRPKFYITHNWVSPNKVTLEAKLYCLQQVHQMSPAQKLKHNFSRKNVQKNHCRKHDK